MVPSTSSTVLTSIVDSVAPAVSVVSVTSVSLVPSEVVALTSDDVKSVPSSETVEMPVDSVALSEVPVDDSISEDVWSSDEVDSPKETIC